MVNSPISSWVTRKPAIAAACAADAHRMVRRPPTRSASQPQNCRAKNAEPSSTDSIAAPCVGRDADVAAEGDHVRHRHRHRRAAAERGERQRRQHQIGRQAEHLLADARFGMHAAERRCVRRAPQKDRRQRQDQDDDEHGIDQHGVAPADGIDAQLEHRRPQRTRRRTGRPRSARSRCRGGRRTSG